MKKIIDGTAYDTQSATLDKKFTYGAPGDLTGYKNQIAKTRQNKKLPFGSLNFKFAVNGTLPIL